jgi:hypothetical protein
MAARTWAEYGKWVGGTGSLMASLPDSGEQSEVRDPYGADLEQYRETQARAGGMIRRSFRGFRGSIMEIGGATGCSRCWETRWPTPVPVMHNAGLSRARTRCGYVALRCNESSLGGIMDALLRQGGGGK